VESNLNQSGFLLQKRPPGFKRGQPHDCGDIAANPL
jgi:hypothetical protein